MHASQFSSVETLRDGRRVLIRAQRPDDAARFLAARAHLSRGAFYDRFMMQPREFSPEEIAYFLEIDFVDQVALVALESDGETLVGSGRYIVCSPGRAEVSFAVIDAYQGQGLAGRIFGHLVALAREAGIKEFVAETLLRNRAMLRVFHRAGLPIETRAEDGVVHVSMKLEAARAA
jgi:GNAT superfamily N-acetyltransferase